MTLILKMQAAKRKNEKRLKQKVQAKRLKRHTNDYRTYRFNIFLLFPGLIVLEPYKLQ